MEFISSSIVLFVVALAVLGTVYLAVDRLLLSPIAHIPGPKLAAFTYWYEFYYDVILKGRYEWAIIDMHKKYGPIVRISPHEVHVFDFDFLDKVFPGNSPGHKIDKVEFSMRMFGNYSSMFSTLGHDMHRLKRQTLAKNFSKQAIKRLEPVIYKNVDDLCDQIQQSKDSGSVLNLTHLFAGYAGDVIMEYTFGSNLGFLKDEEARRNWHEMWMAFMSTGAFAKQFPIFNVILRAMPEWMMVKIDPKLGLLIQVWAMLKRKIEEARTGKGEQASVGIFYDLLHDRELPESHKTIQALVDEGQTLIAAGTVTTSEVLAHVLYHLTDQPKVMEKLRDELKPVMAKTNGRPSLDDLENLQYLNAVLKEGLRLNYGLTQRLPRIHNIDLVYEGIVIPKGTAVGMGAFNIHTNPDYFVKPDDFIPERWTDPTSNQLEKYLIPFSKGTRACLGQTLAWAELYLALANVAAPGRFDYTLFETDHTDIEYVYDWFIGIPKLDSKGVRVTVK